MKIREDLLHFIWKTLTQKQQKFTGTKGEKINISSAGFHNQHEGPDFKEAELIIDGQKWFGNIEIHCKSSDWSIHQHSKDPNYANILLHVVYLHDEEIHLPDGSRIPVIELRNSIDKNSLENFQSLMLNSLGIPCKNLIKEVKPVYLSLQLNQAALGRLNSKAESWLTAVEREKGNWNKVFYQKLVENFGFKTNSKPMQELAKSLPFEVISKHYSNIHQLNALLFGMAGLLNSNSDYCAELSEEFNFLQKKYQLKPIKYLDWKTAKTRPANYPHIRLAQLAELLSKEENLFNKCIAIKDANELIQLFRVRANEYWVKHYAFGKERKKKIDPIIGESSLHVLLINTVAQAIFSYGIYIQKEEVKNRALELLQALPSENNKIVREFKKLGFVVGSSLESQGILHQNKSYCTKKECYNCQIGQQILL